MTLGEAAVDNEKEGIAGHFHNFTAVINGFIGSATRNETSSAILP
jgi:hypothetical protein